MTNLKTDLLEAEEYLHETIISVVVGQHDNRPNRWSNDDQPLSDENILLTREQGLAKLDQEYDSGYGGADCFPMYAWTQSWVIFVAEYDGSTHLAKLPRNPQNGEPQFSGEGT